MAEVEFRLHPLAADEVESARAWYFQRSPAAAAAFLAELDVAILRIQEAPLRWPEFHPACRRFLLHKFPFSVIYLPRTHLIEVIAVAHHRRKPGYWSAR